MAYAMVPALAVAVAIVSGRILALQPAVISVTCMLWVAAGVAILIITRRVRRPKEDGSESGG